MIPENLTRTCQDDEPFSSAALVAVLEQAWAAIRNQHPEVPARSSSWPPGSPAKPDKPMRWGHFADGRWQHGDDQLPEVMVSGEGLSRPADKVFTTLLHEAAHGLAAVRGIKDTSRQGRWHNKQFANLAAELGMTTTKDDKLGFSPCELTELTAARYRATITALGEALNAYRHPETFEGKERTNNNNGVSAECECPRKLRISLTVFEAGPIRCDECGEAFLPEDTDRDEFNAEHPRPNTCDPTVQVRRGRPRHRRPGRPTTWTSTTRPAPATGYPPTPSGWPRTDLATLRQLRAQGLRPDGQDPIAAQVHVAQGRSASPTCTASTRPHPSAPPPHASARPSTRR